MFLKAFNTNIFVVFRAFEFCCELVKRAREYPYLEECSLLVSTDILNYFS